jgi:hypothetical protein
MFTASEFMTGVLLMHVTDPWERISIRVRAFAESTDVSDRDWYARLCEYADRVIAEELRPPPLRFNPRLVGTVYR